MNFTAADIKKLRDITSAPMMECKTALAESNGNIEEAEKILKKKGLAALTSKEGRPTSEGAIFTTVRDNKVAVVELKCETDFVANTQDFKDLGDRLTKAVLDGESDSAYDSMIKEVGLKIRENMTLGRIEVFDIPDDGVFSMYHHFDGKSAGIVCIGGLTDSQVNETVSNFAHDCCLHLVAFNPKYVSKDQVPAKYIEEQTEIFKAQMAADPKMSGKPEKVLDGILQGKINKHCAEICFEDQMFVKDDKKSVKSKLAEFGKNLNFVFAKSYVLGE